MNKPLRLTPKQYNLEYLHEHLQNAVDLEFWTIPFYMAAMYSIQDKSDPAYQLIRTVVNQEMLHLQSAANIANSYGLSPKFKAPVYEGTKIPLLDFSLDSPGAIAPYIPYTAEIGPLDKKHINAMCLIEIPDYLTGNDVHLLRHPNEYGSIGAFYKALLMFCRHLKEDVRGGVRQIDAFSAFYRNMPDMVVSGSRNDGFNQVELLISLITDQGEGMDTSDEKVAHAFQNTADDTAPEEDHFDKFVSIKNAKKLPKTFKGKPVSSYTKEDKELEKIVIEHFTSLRKALEGLFSGENPENFYPIMASVGGAIRNCWEHGVTPKFS
jgi:hypothetical protein